MRSVVITLTIVIGCFPAGVASLRAQEPAAEPDPELQSVTLRTEFHDEFLSDSREAYTRQGTVTWEPGRLTLGAGASVSHSLSAGNRVDIVTRFGGDDGAADATVDVAPGWQWTFRLSGAHSLTVTLQSRRTEPPQWDLSVTRSEHSAPLPDAPRSLRTRAVPDGPVGEYTVAFRHGLVTIRHGEDWLLAVDSEDDRDATVEAITCRCPGARQSLTALHVQSTPPFPPLSPETDALRSTVAAELKNLEAAYARGRFAEAADAAEQILETRLQIYGRWHPLTAVSRNDLGLVLGKLRQFPAAERQLRESLTVRRNLLGDWHPDTSSTLNNLATLYLEKGDYPTAGDFAREAVERRSFVMEADAPKLLTSLGNLASLYLMTGDYVRAEILFRRVRDALQAKGQQQSLSYATVLTNLGSLFQELGDYGQAEEHFVQAREIFDAQLGAGHPQGALIRNNLAGVLEQMGRLEDAASLYREASEIWKASLGENHPRYATSLLNQSGILIELERFVEAQQQLQNARTIWEAAVGTDNANYAKVLNNLGEFARRTGTFAAAGSYYEQAAAIWKTYVGEQHPMYGRLLGNQAECLRAQQQLEQAGTLHRQGFDLLLETAEAVLPTLPAAQASRWYQENGPRLDLMLTYLRRRPVADPRDAYGCVWRAKMLATRLRIHTIPPRNPSPELAALLADVREARQQLARLFSSQRTGMPTGEDFRTAFVAATSRKESLERELAAAIPASERQIRIRDARVDDLLERIPPDTAVVDFVLSRDWPFEEHEIPWQDADGEPSVRQVLRETAVPEYHAFILRSPEAEDGAPEVQWIPLGPAAPIDAAIARWREELVEDAPFVNDADRKPGPAAVLRERIWNPLEAGWSNVSTVILIPDGRLHELPWAALPGRQAGSYLLEQYALATASYGQQLSVLLEDHAANDTRHLVLAGGIDYDTRPEQLADATTRHDAQFRSSANALPGGKRQILWNPLPGTRAELEAIQQLWDDPDTLVSLGDRQATEANLMEWLPEARIAHFATHGFFERQGTSDDDTLPSEERTATVGSQSPFTDLSRRSPLLNTGIVLAGANLPPQTDAVGLPVGDDGILTAEEIVGLDLRATDLVTLSACETGLGQIAAGEGVFGLRRALHQAGVRSVVASLWKVDDRATKILMTEFYRNLWVQRMSRIQALRQAQLAVMAGFDPGTGRWDRGLGRRVARVTGNEPAAATTDRTRVPPRFWAAFQLSGDWR